MAEKKIIVISKGSYKGVDLLETQRGTITFYLGTQPIEVPTIENAKTVIDSWYALKTN